MKKLFIKVKVPTKKDKRFSFSVAGFPEGIQRKRLNPVWVYRYIESCILKAKVISSFQAKAPLKINVLIDYLHGYRNEAEYSGQNAKKRALYALVCFMENYLPEDFRRGREKRYEQDSFT